MAEPNNVKTNLIQMIWLSGLPFYIFCLTTGCPKINETHKIANKYVDFNPIVYIFQI